jgi:hypothetical protein
VTNFIPTRRWAASSLSRAIAFSSSSILESKELNKKSLERWSCSDVQVATNLLRSQSIVPKGKKEK